MSTHVYRLKVTLPEGSEWPWEPEGWREFAVDRGLVEPDGEPAPFFWPANRLYFSRSGAVARAEQFRRWGATVEIERSNAVTWAEGS